MRSEAREVAFKIIYADLLNPTQENQFKANTIKKAALDEEDDLFAHTLITLVDEHKDELTATINENVKRFVEYRIYPVDRAIMMLALAEIKYMDDIPSVVSVSEAVALAKKYSTENSIGFVNGVLGGIINA